MDPAGCKHEKTKLVEINPYLTCHLCSGYLIDATTISECLHSFCRSCIIKFLQQNSYCPICEVIINKAKPNIKLDKTLQDIVYKLVPELFIREMTRRQQFYKNHPEMAAKVTPEERGVDTERTIFNPKDAISLSIEYIRDDSTPGAILIASPTETPINAKNIADNHSDNQMKRFLQCPGMCRIEVLKKFVRNKYNVDTNTFHIVILYKRVPLPNHYTLIDIAYIYSWKRNEPMKFFFRITDKNLATDGFDFIDDSPPPPEIFVRPTRTAKISGEKARSKGNAKKKVVVEKAAPKAPDVDVINTDKIKDEIKSKLQSDSNDKGPVYTNITLNRSNNVEIITKVQKVSNRNGQPIGLNIIKQTVKKARFAAEKPNVVAEKDESKPVMGKIILQRSESTPIVAEIKNEVIPTEAVVDEEKSNFLKSIELTAKTEASSPIKKEPVKTPLKAAQKRKSSSPVRNDRVKKAKVEKGKNTKNLKNPDVRHMVKNVRNSATKLSKLVQKAPSNTNLQSLFDSCKINIPSSLSITLKESSEDDGDRLTATSMKPVQNYIEILKIPDQGEDKSKVADVENKPAPKPALKDNVVKLNPRSAQTFQKMFEEAIKKPEVNDKDDDKKSETESSTRRNILEIASRLYKKTKLDLEREEGAKAPAGKIAIPRLNTQKCLKPQKLDAKIANFRFEQTFANMHSPSLGMNYTVSVENERKKPNGLTIETKPADGPSTAKTVKNTKLQNVPTTPAKNLLALQTLRNPTQNLPVSLQNALKYSMEFKQTPANGKTAVSSPLTSPRNWARNSSQSSPRPSSSPKPSSPSNVSPRPYISPRAATTPNVSPRSNASPKPNVSPRPNMSPIPNVPSPRLKPLNVPSVKDKIPNRTAPQPAHLSSTPMSPNQILEKYNIQNLAQLTASFNFNQSAAFGLPHSPHLAALQQAVILKQFEMQNRQSWLNMNQNSLVQYEKYLQSLSHGGLVTKEN